MMQGEIGCDDEGSSDEGSDAVGYGCGVLGSGHFQGAGGGSVQSSGSRRGRLVNSSVEPYSVEPDTQPCGCGHVRLAHSV